MDKQIENWRSQNISRCDVRVYGNGRSRAVAWVSVVSQLFVRALCSWLSVWQCCWLVQIFFWVKVILFCTCTRVQVRNTAASCGFPFLSADSRKEPPLRTQVGDRRGHHPLTSLCTYVVTCMGILISGDICWVCMFHTSKHVLYVSKCYTAKSFFVVSTSSEMIQIDFGS